MYFYLFLVSFTQKNKNNVKIKRLEKILTTI